jgi:hypothetical protein
VSWASAYVFAFESYFSCARLEQAGNGSQRRCFAGAIRADEGNDFTLFHVHGNTGERLNSAVVNGDVVQSEHKLNYFCLWS